MIISLGSISTDLTAIHTEGTIIPNAAILSAGDIPGIPAVIQVQDRGNIDCNYSVPIRSRRADGLPVQAEGRRAVQNNLSRT